MPPATPILLSAVIIGLLGSMHLLMTFVGPKLLPRDRDVHNAMQSAHPVITTQTTMWRAWIGFNASHSMGALLFALVYGYFALVEPQVLFQSPALQFIGLTMLLGYMALAIAYWFITPRLGIAVALLSYVLGLVLSWS